MTKHPTPLRYADGIEQCRLSDVTRKRFAQVGSSQFDPTGDIPHELTDYGVPLTPQQVWANLTQGKIGHPADPLRRGFPPNVACVRADGLA